MTTYGLIGYPLGHSFSASFFTRKFEAEGIDAEYRNFPLENISELEELVSDQSELEGFNVTVPYKEQIIPHLDALNKTARAVGAVNTVRICNKNDCSTLIGYNTDVIGFERSLKEHLKPDYNRALVLGTGGSSKAVVFVLDAMGIEYKIVSRSRGEGVVTYEELDHSLVAEHPLIINTTPLGMHPHVDACPEIIYEAITPGHLLFDLVYNPEKTLFLSRGEAQGASIVNGYDMLVYQAEGSWEIWNKKR